MNKGVFEKLRELEGDDLRFPEMEHGDLDLRIEATSYLMKGDEIDVRIREKLSGIGYVLKNMRCESSQDIPQTCFGGPWSEAEIEYEQSIPRQTYYTFLYDVAEYTPPSDDVPDKHVGESPWLPPNFAADNLALLNEPSVFTGKFITNQNDKFNEEYKEWSMNADSYARDKLFTAAQGQSSCPDCPDGFYTPFTGPKEKCRTCNGTMKVTVAAPQVEQSVQPSTGDDLKDDFGQYVSSMLELIDLGLCGTELYTDYTWSEEVCFRFRIGDQDLDPKINWDGPEFGRRFCEAVRADILSRTPLAITRRVKLHFDFSTLQMGYNGLWQSHEMYIAYHMRKVQ